MKKALSSLIVVLCIILVTSCGEESEKCYFIPQTDEMQLQLGWEPLEAKICSITSKKELSDFLTTHEIIREVMFRRSEYPDDSIFLNQLYSRITNPHFDSLRQETERIFTTGESLKAEFESAFKNISYYYPNFVPPKVQTIITGLDTDLYVSDTLIVVGLDYYLGRGAKYRPLHMYQYLLRKYDPSDIVPSVMLLYGISDQFNVSDPNDKTVLADMIAYGKSYQFAKAMLPCTPDSVLISYTPEEIKGARSNQDLIWARFLESQVLFSTSHVVKKSYLADRPFTLEVGEKCPGRIGQWVGWEIVRKYAATNPETSFQELMKLRDANKILQESRYKPVR